MPQDRRAAMSPEKVDARREMDRMRQQKRRAAMTPEEVDARRP
jgi:hypothetical protein